MAWHGVAWLGWYLCVFIIPKAVQSLPRILPADDVSVPHWSSPAASHLGSLRPESFSTLPVIHPPPNYLPPPPAVCRTYRCAFHVSVRQQVIRNMAIQSSGSRAPRPVPKTTTVSKISRCGCSKGPTDNMTNRAGLAYAVLANRRHHHQSTTDNTQRHEQQCLRIQTGRRIQPSCLTQRSHEGHRHRREGDSSSPH